jgi:hypothetical protein
LPSPSIFDQGWAWLVMFEQPVIGLGPVMFGPSTGLRYRGLPAIGFAATRIINGNARPGLIANYAGAQPHRGVLEAVLIEAGSQTVDTTR